MKHSGVSATKHIFMALINAYAACGKFERAKQVCFNCHLESIAVKYFHFIKAFAPNYPAIVVLP